MTTLRLADSNDRPYAGRRRRGAVAAATVAAVLALAACGSGQSVAKKGGHSLDSSNPLGFKTAKQDSSAAITVWVDSTRLPVAQAYKKTHPGTPVKIVSYDGDANGSNTFKTKSQLYDRAGSGWPDVVFTADDNAASWGSVEGDAALAPVNKGLVPTATLNGFAKGALDVCTLGGVTYCLRNDLAQNVLWYNKKLMDQWGYQVPTTWEQYAQLADKVATQHPGYIVGSAGDAWAPEIYMWGAECPANQVTGAKAITVDTSDGNCVKAAKMLDHLIANKTMSTLSIFGPEFAKKQGSKTLMLPGPSWYGGSVFQGTLKTPKGQIAAGPALSWAGQNPPVTGDVGGGAWWISAHSKNVKAAAAFAEWATTNYRFGSQLAPTYPAYTPAATKWIAAQAASGYYASGLAAPIQQAASRVWSGWGSAGFSQEAVWAKVVQSGMTQGKSVESLLPAWQNEIVNQAKVLGYSVTTK